MRRAQLSLRQLGTIVAVAIFVATAALGSLPRPHPAELAARAVAAQSGPFHHLPGGRRWF